MKMTITLGDDLWVEAKRRALQSKKTLQQVIEEALRAWLAAGEGKPRRKPFRLVTFRGDGPLPGVNLDKTSELLEEEDRRRH